jgi:hypothetical protein
MSYAHCRQSFFEKFRRQAPVKSAIEKMIKKFRCEEHGEMNGHHFQHLL